MWLSAIGGLLYVFFVAVFLYPLRQASKLNPACWFYIFNAVMAIGIFPKLDFDKDEDIIHAVVLFSSCVAYGVSINLSSRLFALNSRARRYWRRPITFEGRWVRFALVACLVLSMIIVTLYYLAVGYNLFVSTLTGGGGEDFTTQRLNAYATGEYFAPGYVNQFKNTWLPIILFYFSFYIYFKFRIRVLVFFLLFALPVLLIAVLGTGQRTFFVFVVLILVFSYTSIFNKRINFRKLVVPGALFLAVFGMFSVSLGRTDEFSFYSALESLLVRIFNDNQESAVVGFRYVYSMPFEYGGEWMQDVIGILPGQKGSDLAGRIHALIYGSDRGTAPVSVWGSVYLNFSLIGVPLMAAIFAFFFSFVYLVFLSGQRSLLRIICYSAICVYISLWVAGSPVQILNNGVVAVGALLFINRYLSAKNGVGIHRV